MAAKTWTNVGVAMQSAIAAAKTITAITKASPGVATSTAHGYSNGDVVLLKIQGMAQLDYAVVRVSGVTTNSFEIEGWDTSSFDTFSSGTAEALTFGTTFSTMGDLNTSGGDFEMIDVSTVHDAQKKSIPGSASPTEVSGNFNWDPSDAGQVAMKNASRVKTVKGFRLSFSDGSKWYFCGYPGYQGNPAGSAQGKVSSPFKISGYGPASFYAS